MIKLAVLGDPISGSKSPQLHNAAIKALGLNALYFAISCSDIKAALNALSGANITYPFKQDAFLFCNHLSLDAKAIGGVNTMFLQKGLWHGYNTDWQGFAKCLEGINPRRVLILGSGSTAKALIYALSTKKIPFYVASRSKNEGYFIPYQRAAFLQEDAKTCFDLVVNATPAGLIDNDYPCDKLTLQAILSKAKHAMDLNYSKNTAFLSLAKEAKCITQNGENMLVWQAVYAFRIFFALPKSLENTIFLAMKEAL